MFTTLKLASKRARASTQLQPLLHRGFVSSSASFAAKPNRAPTFTTPELPPTIYDEDPSKPLPPTNLPQEDYASPLAHTAGVFSSFFRSAVYGSVTVVTLGVLGLVGVHYWVEKVSLSGGGRDEDAFNWKEEVDGWSGGHLGGGTDPRLGTVARAAIRGAWIAQHWGVGSATSPVSSSPFSVGGATIGSAGIAPLAVKEIGDAGWHLAERYLMFALDKANARGMSLCSVGDGRQGTASVDRAMVELEQRLAGIRELLGGQYRLEEARDAWKRIYYALSTSLSPSPLEQREKLRASKKLGDLSVRLADMWAPGSPERQMEKETAQGWLVGELLLALQHGGEAMEQVAEASFAALEPSRGFFGFFSRAPTKSAIPVEVASLVNSLTLHCSKPSISLDPASCRAVLSSLVSLETFVARDRQLATAAALQAAALQFSQSCSLSLLPTASSIPDISTAILALPPFVKSTPTANSQLYQLHLLARSALFSTHLAEVTLASESTPTTRASALDHLATATKDCDLILAKTPVLTGTALPFTAAAKFTKAQRVAMDALVRDARLTKTLADGLVQHIQSARLV